MKPKLYFDPVIGAGTTYDLGHLEPFKLPVDSQKVGKTLIVDVRFSNHCFTNAYDIALQLPDFPILYDAGGRERSFCMLRYELSMSLPALIQGMPNPKVSVWETAERRNWAYSVAMPVEGSPVPYHVFFELKRAQKDARALQDLSMVVESAYPEDPLKGPPNLLGKMSFSLLCGKIYCGEKASTRR